MLCFAHGHAQTARARTDCFSVGSYHEKFTDVLSATTNPAVLAFCRSFSTGVYAERRFLMSSLRHVKMAAAIPLGRDGLGIQVEHLAAAGYSQSGIGMGYARNLGRVMIGARFYYNMLAVAGYGKASGMAVEAGSHWAVTDNMRVAMVVYLPAGGQIKTAHYYKSGIGYKISDQLLLAVEAYSERGSPPGIHTGLYYRPSPKWMLQLGITTTNAQPYICTALQWATWRILITVTQSMQLGQSPGLALFFQPENRAI